MQDTYGKSLVDDITIVVQDTFLTTITWKQKLLHNQYP